MRNRLFRGRSAVSAALASLLLLAWLPVVPIAPAEAAAPAVIRIGLIRTMFRDAPDPVVKVMTNIFKSLMEEQTGLPNDVSAPDDFAQLAQQLKDGKLQLGVFHGFEFAWAREKTPELKPLMVVVKRQSFVRALLVVNQANKAEDVVALRGQTLALSMLARQHCRLFLSRRCVGPDSTADKWYGKVTTPRTDRDALDDVAEGFAQATVVDDVELEEFRKAYPKSASRLRVLKESEKLPASVVAYQPGSADAGALKQLQTGMIAAKTTERGRKLLEIFHMTGFEAVPEGYEQSLADSLKAYPAPAK